MHSKSVVAWGSVSFVDDFDRKVEILNIFMKQYSDNTFKYSAPAVANVKVWTVPLEEITCKEVGVSRKK
jgi:hypothetical protein